MNGSSEHAAGLRFVTLYSACPSGIALTDSAGKIVDANPALAGLLEVTPERLQGSGIVGLGAGEKDRAALSELLDELDTGVSNLRTERELLELAYPEGKPKRAHVCMANLPTDTPGTFYPAVFVEDADELSGLRETFEHQSVSDPLTNLANASRFRSYLESTLGTDPDQRIALTYFDIDGFKVINDGIGSEAADEILRVVAARLDTAFRADTMLLARLSGDGFGVVLRGAFGATDVIGVVERAIESLAEPVYVDGVGVGVSASAGIVVRQGRGADPDRLIEGAQIALHRAKEKGKAQWVLYDPDTDSADRAQYRLGAALACGLETGEFTVGYRPGVVLPDAATVASLEAELWWDHPEHGPLRATEFHHLAETTGMAVPLGRQLLAEAAETAADRRRRFGADAAPVRVFLPRRLAVDGDLVRIVKSELERHDLPAASLWLCADSPSILDERGDFLESMRILAEAGTVFVLEVTGSADLEVIHTFELPVRAVMLAGHVVDAVADEDPLEAAERHVTQLVHRATELGLTVGATGVTSESHAARLHALGVRVATGPYLGEIPA